MSRDRRNETQPAHFTKMIRNFMETPAWRALSTSAQALYVWLKLEWKGPRANNNGHISLSVRQAAERLNVTRNTAARAFHQLQEKGFIVMTRPAQLGVSGQAKTPTYEITEIAMPGEQSGSKLYRFWREGSDFRVEKATTHNPGGRNGRSSCYAESCHGNGDEAVIKLVTKSKVPSSKS